jgi:hypothetical protein
MRRFFYLIALLALPSALASQIQTAVASGSAYDTGVSNELTQKRAIADALENFMFQNGAKLSSLTIIDNGVIKLDQLKVSAETRVLGFQVIDKQLDGNKVTVILKVLYGGLEQEDKCTNPQQLRLSYPKISIKHANNLPPYLSNLSTILQDQIKAIATRQMNLQFVNAKTKTHKKPTGNLADYASLVSAQTSNKKNKDKLILSNDEHSLEVALDLHYNRDGQFLTARFWPSSTNIALQAQLKNVETRAQTNKLAITLPFKLVPRNRSKIINELLDPLVASIEESIKLASCTPKSAKLQKFGKYFKINLGRHHGIQQDSVFLPQNGQPTGFVVQALDAKQTTLKPLEGTITQSNFDGEIVYLLQ